MSKKCLSCGSTRIVPDLPLLDHFGEWGSFSSQAQVQVHGVPQSWLFRDTVAGKLVADICGDCGHAQVRVANARELYEKYQQSLGK